jgi:hypothetical protein
VGAGALIETAQPAAAANGTAVTAGNVTTGEIRTSVLYDGPANYTGVVLLGNDSTYTGTGANFPAGVGGWAGAGSTAGAAGVQNGVYGYTDNGGGNGVVGYNSGLVSGTGAGVLGLAFTAANIGVQGTNSAGTAVSGSSDSGIGVNGSGGTGTGVSGDGAVGMAATGSTTGLTASGPTAVAATGSTTGLTAAGTGAGSRGGTFSGKAAQVQLIPGTGATHPRSGKAGDLYLDKTSRLWLCRTGGTTATWVKIV